MGICGRVMFSLRHERSADPQTHLPVKVEQIEREQAYADFDVLHLDVLAFPPAELLEWKQLRRVLVDGHRLGVEHKRLRAFLDTLRA